mmetsp:Transcript_47405/g.109729  ORF Transcript_47405/g.109729 Transcript_47405/m.109729 type:complete len:86 (-) Transcript_47405:2665-2922(-)
MCEVFATQCGLRARIAHWDAHARMHSGSAVVVEPAQGAAAPAGVSLVAWRAPAGLAAQSHESLVDPWARARYRHLPLRQLPCEAS